MRIVVTGALGHIGSRLIREIPSVIPDHQLCLLDNLSSQRYASLFNLPPEGRYEFHEVDIMEADLVSHFQGADAVIHLAAITNAEGSFEHQAEVENVNFRGTERVARACIAVGAPLVFLSTTSVYGTQSDVVDEDCPESELKPQSPYADSKLRAERLLSGLARDEGLRHVTFRFGTIFGPSPGMRFHTAVNKFVWQAVNGQPLTVWRTALHQKRPYLDLADGVRALVTVLRDRRFDGGLYNIVTINATVADIIEAIRPNVPSLEVKYVDSKIMNQLSYTVSAKRSESIGITYCGDLHEAVAESVRWLAGIRRGP